MVQIGQVFTQSDVPYLGKNKRKTKNFPFKVRQSL